MKRQHIPKSLVQVPLEKLKARVNKNNKEYVILLSTGAYSPVHRMHLEILMAAKEYLEKECKLIVLAGFLSPSNDSYVKGKLGDQWIPSHHRLAMLKLAVADYDWIDICDWELKYRGWGSPTKLIQHIAKFAEENIAGIQIRPIYVCGADHANKYVIYKQGQQKEVVAVGRLGYTQKLKEALAKLKQENMLSDIFHFVEKELSDFSSTSMRQKMQHGESIEDITFPSVAKYILNNYSKFQEDDLTETV